MLRDQDGSSGEMLPLQEQGSKGNSEGKERRQEQWDARKGEGGQQSGDSGSADRMHSAV